MGFRAFVSKVRKQTAVYWAPAEYSKTNEAFTFEDPVELRVRWSGTNEQLFNDDGTPYQPKYKVIVPQEVATGGFLWEGSLSSLSYQEKKDPFKVLTAYRIKALKEIPDFKATYTYRVAYL